MSFTFVCPECKEKVDSKNCIENSLSIDDLIIFYCNICNTKLLFSLSYGGIVLCGDWWEKVLEIESGLNKISIDMMISKEFCPTEHLSCPDDEHYGCSECQKDSIQVLIKEEKFRRGCLKNEEVML